MSDVLYWLFVQQSSWICMAVSLLSMKLYGDKTVWGPVTGLVGQVFWVLLGIYTGQPALIVSATLFYGPLHIRNWVKWRREQGTNRRLFDSAGLGTIVFDFDGVIHPYSKGWNGGEIYDDPDPECIPTLKWLIGEGFTVAICTARTDTLPKVRRWLAERGFPPIEVTNQKPVGVLYPDDRGYRFDGDWKKFRAALPGLVHMTREKERVSA